MKSNTLTFEESYVKEDLIDTSIESIETIRYCLNCGCKVSGNFCSNCGQSTAVPERINNRTFGKSVIMSFSRLSSAFLNTLIKLCYKPWEVIRDYIHGKQVRYSHPVTMLIQITLIITFLKMVLEGVFDINLIQNVEEDTSQWLIRTLRDSVVIRMLWLSIPFIFAGYLVYWNNGSRRFSFSEYIVAALYLLITVNIYTFLFQPLNYVLFNGDSNSNFIIVVIVLVSLVFGSITVLKSFPIVSRWKKIGFYVLFIGVALLFYIVYFIGFSLIEALISGEEAGQWMDQFFGE